MGRQVLTLLERGVHIWDFETGAASQRLVGTPDSLNFYALDISSDGEKLLTMASAFDAGLAAFHWPAPGVATSA